MRGSALVRAALAAVILSLSTASFVAAAGPVYAQHRYVVDGVYSRYDITGGPYSTGMGCRGPCSTSVQTSYSWANSWSATITFSKASIDAAVGYNTTATGSVSYTQTFPIPSGRTGVIWYRDYYHITLLNVHHDTCYPYSGCTTEYGTASSKQWFQRIYYVVLS